MKRVAVLIPCYNEEETIASVIVSFKKCLPNAIVYVYDNCSDDRTFEIAQKSGAIVVLTKNRGKGNVVRKMFADIDADIYVMADGDSTYNVQDAIKMIDMMENTNVDMIVAARKEKTDGAFKNGHKIGNKLFNFILKALFNSTFSDIFSGYRAFSRRFVKTFPVMTNGFDIEAELSIHALTLSIPFAEISSEYSERPSGSYSKLSTFRDGFKILFSVVKLLKETRPLFFFGIIFVFLFFLSIFIAYPIVMTFLKTGLVPRLPTAVLSTGIMIISFFSLSCGMILDSISQARMETKKLHYLLF
jgi:glycosyltransferase involved in cell wall biosynthesis